MANDRIVYDGNNPGPVPAETNNELAAVTTEISKSLAAYRQSQLTFAAKKPSWLHQLFSRPAP